MPLSPTPALTVVQHLLLSAAKISQSVDRWPASCEVATACEKKEHEANWCVNIIISEEETTESDVKKFKRPGTANVLYQDV